MSPMVRSTPAAKPLGRPRDVDSAATRRELLDGARQIFARDGFEATTNRSIADAVGVTTSAIYHYFPSKGDLFAAVFADAEEVVFDAFEQAVTGGGSLTARFERMLEAAVRLNRLDPSLGGFLVTVPLEVNRHSELADLMVPRHSRSGALISE